MPRKPKASSDKNKKKPNASKILTAHYRDKHVS